MDINCLTYFLNTKPPWSVMSSNISNMQLQPTEVVHSIYKWKLSISLFAAQKGGIVCVQVPQTPLTACSYNFSSIYFQIFSFTLANHNTTYSNQGLPREFAPLQTKEYVYSGYSKS